MNNLRKTSIALGIVLVIAACNPIKFIQKKVEQIMVQADPEFLEVHGTEVEYSLKGKFPAKVFHKKAYITVTPILVYNGGTLKLDPVKYRGEKTSGDGKVIPFKTGGGFSCSGTFPFKDEMAGKDAVLNLEIEVCKDPETCQTFTKENLAKGVITTSRLITNDDRVFYAGYGKNDNGEENAKSITNLKRNFKRTIFFDLNRWNVKTSEKKSDRMNELWAFVKTPRLELQGISVNSYASPDGELKLNQDLTDKRSSSTYEFLDGELKNLKLSSGDENLYKRQAMEEDWAGLKKLVTASSLSDKNEALQIINSSKSNDDKEAELRKLDSWETMLVEMMPQLRRSDVTLQATVKNRPMEELNALAAKSYEGFNPKELLIFAASTADMKKKMSAYEAFIKARPTSIVGYNNVAACLILEGKLDKALDQLNQAKTKAGDNDSLYNNYGVIYRKNGELDKALEAYQRTQKAGVQVGYNMAIINVIHGDYSSARTNMPSSACGGNAALVSMLSGDLTSAASRIDCKKEKTALDFYINAIVAARAKNALEVGVNLKSAVALDKSFANKATNDLEFHSYWDAAEFKNAINR